jgi:CRP-like cAMP-binding protein
MVMEKIRENTLFKDLNAEQVSYVLKLITVKKYRPGDIIIRENSVGNSMFLLTKGEISIEKDLIPLIEGYESGPDDKKVIRLKDDQNVFFGEMSLFDSTLKRTATIRAVSDVETAEITDHDFDGILKERHDIGVIILKNIATRLSRTLENSNVELSKMITAFTLSLKL